jgi:HK97 family phage prohead protease
MDLITKQFHEVKFSGMDGTGPGEFFGYASKAEELDSGNDIVDHGAFLADLPSFLGEGFFGLGHDWAALPLGTMSEAYEDDTGLYLKGEYHSTPQAQQARQVAIERMDRGKSVGLSIGFKINPGGSYVDDDGHRHLKSVRLYEVSQVNVPMLRSAGLTSVKGFGLDFEDHSEQVRVALVEWLERAMSGSDVRLKEGRAISTARMASMAKMRDALHGHAAEIQAMLDEVTPKPKAEESPEDYSALYTGWLLTQARLNGLPILN